MKKLSYAPAQCPSPHHNCRLLLPRPTRPLSAPAVDPANLTVFEYLNVDGELAFRDASAVGGIGVKANHATSKPNCTTFAEEAAGLQMHIVIHAAANIPAHGELMYDYRTEIENALHPQHGMSKCRRKH